MINAILLSENIFKRMNECDDLKAYVGKKIFPLIAEINTTFPYVVYSRENVTPNYTKDFDVEDDCSFQIIVADNDYFRSLKISNIIRSLFDGVGGVLSTYNLKVNKCKFSGISEAYDDINEAFIQRLYFTCKVQ